MVDEQVARPELLVRREKLSSMREIDVFDPQAWDSRIMRESWQVYWMNALEKQIKLADR